MQYLGSWKRPVAYYCKQLDNVAKGWPSCLRALVATSQLVQEAVKLTLGHPMEVYTPHHVTAILQRRGGKWLTSSQVLKYQAELLEVPEVELNVMC